VSVEKVIIVGGGRIGKHLGTRLVSRGVDVLFTGRTHAGAPFARLLQEEQPQAVFVCISTLDQGEAARDYILASVRAGISVITCEKGALAYHAVALKPHLNNIGSSATVGGGTRMLKYLSGRRLGSKKVEIHAVLNGTLNFIFDEVGRGGRTLGEACEEALRLGYAEPGASDPLSLINGELKDIAMKVRVLFNTVLATGALVVPTDFRFPEVTEDRLQLLGEEGKDYRFTISFTNYKPPKEYMHFAGEWYFSAGFRQVNRMPHLATWLPGGVGNALHIIEGELGSGGKYTLSGPGAGHEPTTSAMLADFEELCSRE
jgi:homoserine dehydrogenase